MKITNPNDLLHHIVQVLERLQIRYFVTGSVASIRYGEPRTTLDIDVVVELPPTLAAAFAAEFPSPDFRIDPETVKQATIHRTPFNILHPASGYKIDVMLTDRSEFKHIRDIAAMLKINGSRIDRQYIEYWARQFDVWDYWNLAVDRAHSR